jgi:hypothetical protein
VPRYEAHRSRLMRFTMFSTSYIKQGGFAQQTAISSK